MLKKFVVKKILVDCSVGMDMDILCCMMLTGLDFKSRFYLS